MAVARDGRGVPMPRAQYIPGRKNKKCIVYFNGVKDKNTNI